MWQLGALAGQTSNSCCNVFKLLTKHSQKHLANLSIVLLAVYVQSTETLVRQWDSSPSGLVVHVQVGSRAQKCSPDCIIENQLTDNCSAWFVENDGAEIDIHGIGHTFHSVMLCKLLPDFGF